MAAPNAAFEEGLDRKQLQLIRKRFLHVNKERLERFRIAARERECDMVDLLPMLWHVNHPALPGWIDYESPCSLSDYTPSHATLLAAKKIAKAFEYEKRAALRRDLYALFLMGSSGSLGHSGQSDLDVWLIYRPELAPEQVQRLHNKAQRISTYAQQNGVAMHVYLMTETQVQNGDFGQLGAEHSGSTQHKLLLDEFYRSAILLAGRFPIWWLVPADANAHYAEYTEFLLQKRFVKAGETVDFGTVATIPSEEFFSASVWQLTKALDAPYKSLLKLSLMESFAQSPQPPPLSLVFKQRVYQDQTSAADLDPYLMLFKHVEHHFKHPHARLRLDLIRKALYLKAGIKLSQSPPSSDWQRDMMAALVAEWRWPRSQLLALDNRRHWKVEIASHERQQLADVLQQSANALQHHARHDTQLAAQNQQELNVLFRKQMAMLEKRAGKIERINLNIAPDLSEQSLTAFHVSSQSFSLLRGLHNAESAESATALKRFAHLTELIMWAHLNGLVHRRTRLALVSNNPNLSLPELATLTRDLLEFFTELDRPVEQSEFIHEPTPTRLALCVNIGVDPTPHLSKHNLQLVSSRNDALSYGSNNENLVKHIELIWQNTWGEIQTFSFSGAEAVPLALMRLYELLHQTADSAQPAELKCFCASPYKGHSIEKRLQELLTQFQTRWMPAAQSCAIRVLLRTGEGFTELQLDEQNASYRHAKDITELMSWLAEPLPPAQDLIFDHELSRDFDFEIIYRQRRQNRIQIFFRRVLDRADVFILDEADALVLCQYPAVDLKYLLPAWQRFLTAVNDRQCHLAGLATHGTPECFEIVSNGDTQSPQLKRAELNTWPAENTSIQVTARTLARKHDIRALVITVNQIEFSFLEHGAEFVQRAAEAVRAMRNALQTYPVYLTDLILTDTPNKVSTAFYVREKRALEDILNRSA